jgi:hypothetical protein
VAAGLIKKKRRKRDKRNRHRYLQDDTPMIHLPKPNFASKVSVISKGHVSLGTDNFHDNIAYFIAEVRKLY